MRFVDTHCHLDFPGLAERIDEVIARARQAGGAMIVTIATRRAGWPQALALAEAHPEVWAVLGIHPHHAGEEGLDDPAPLVEAARHPKVVGVGEAGLDYHYDFAPRAAQERNFRTHIEAARRTGLPLVVHTREAEEDTARILEEEMEAGAFGGVLHCFSAGRELAERALAVGFHLGIGGILTFKRAEALRELVRELPPDRLLLETDAPYLAPVPYRGRTNEPAYLVETAKRLAAIRGMSLDEVARVTTDNALRLFHRARLVETA